MFWTDTGKSDNKDTSFAYSQLSADLCLHIVDYYHGRLDLKDSRNRTPAHYCAHPLVSDGIRFLKEHVPRTFQDKDADGSTPEQLAEKHGRLQAFQEAATSSRDQDRAVCEAFEEDVGMTLRCDHPEYVPMGFRLVWAEDIFQRHRRIIDFGFPFRFCNTSRGRAWSIHALELACAVRCPNPAACPSVDKAADVDGAYWKCPREYVGVGCSQCATNFGRSMSDPFVCSECGHFWLHWVIYLGKHLGLFCFSLYTASRAKRGRFRQSALLKILLSFGTVAVSMAPTVKSSAALRHFMDVLAPKGNKT